MVKDAEAHDEEDRRRRDEAETRNKAATLVYLTEKLLKEQGDKVPAEEKEAVQASLGRLKDAQSSEDSESLKSAIEDLMTTSQAFTQKLYEAASAENAGQYDAGAAAGAGATGADDDEVVDAEVIDDDESN
ncbi:MAG: Hsp70 family protein, partial [Acidimicrobiales bacterium]|nr:Hsp70 family protein [Acidimicrobiales bacterium]